MPDVVKRLIIVSTHSRPKAAGYNTVLLRFILSVSTHSRPKAAADKHRQHPPRQVFQHTAARRRLLFYQHIRASQEVSTHSRPKAAAYVLIEAAYTMTVSTHSRPKAADQARMEGFLYQTMFQHTAARRRLELKMKHVANIMSFNTQPPEGG